MISYKVKASVTFGAAPVRTAASVAGWQRLNLKRARYITLAATVNGAPIQAVMDTGASRSVIKPSLATQLSLPVVGTVEATAFTKDVIGTLYRVREIDVGEAILRAADISSYDLSGMENSIVEQLPLVIGQDLLAKTVLEINFPRDAARLVNKSDPGIAQFERLPVTISPARLPLISIGLGSQPANPAILDLGSNVVCTVSDAFARQHELTAGKRTSNTLTVGVEGESVSTIFCLPKIHLGSFILHDVPVCIVRDWKLSAPINVGWPFFAAFHFVLNMREQALMLDADTTILAAPFPKDRSGIGAARLSDRIVVRHVAENSPAQHAGLTAGDEILELDGRRIDPTYPSADERQGLKAAGTRMSMTLSDGRVITMVLADYF